MLFFAGIPVDEAALAGGAILLITRRAKPDEVYREIDFALLAMFAAAWRKVCTSNRLPVMAFFATLLSNLVSNVPAVMIFKPAMPHLADPQSGWLALALFSTFCRQHHAGCFGGQSHCRAEVAT